MASYHRGWRGSTIGDRRECSGCVGGPDCACGRPPAAGPRAEAPDDHHVDGPAGRSLKHLPFTKTVGDELYFAPESGRSFASPMDEAPSDPCDAQPDELLVALAAFRMEERTTVKVESIHGRWAGLRTFTPDRRPAVDLLPTPFSG